MKTKEEFNKLKNEVEALNGKLSELNEEELSEVVGGLGNENNITDYEIYAKLGKNFPSPEIPVGKIMEMDVDTIDMDKYPTWEIIPTP